MRANQCKAVGRGTPVASAAGSNDAPEAFVRLVVRFFAPTAENEFKCRDVSNGIGLQRTGRRMLRSRHSAANRCRSGCVRLDVKGKRARGTLQRNDFRVVVDPSGVARGHCTNGEGSGGKGA